MRKNRFFKFQLLTREWCTVKWCRCLTNIPFSLFSVLLSRSQAVVRMTVAPSPGGEITFCFVIFGHQFPGVTLFFDTPPLNNLTRNCKLSLRPLGGGGTSDLQCSFDFWTIATVSVVETSQQLLHWFNSCRTALHLICKRPAYVLN